MVKIDIEYIRLKQALKRLPVKKRARLISELQKDTLQEQFRQMFRRIDARVKRHPKISQKEIVRLVKETRRELNATRSNRSA